MKKAAEAPEAKKSKSGIRRDKLQHDYWKRLMFWRMINGKIENSFHSNHSKKGIKYGGRIRSSSGLGRI